MLGTFAVWLASAPAQVIDERKCIAYTTQQGLSANKVTGLAQDENGFIWIATTNGLTRFDGNNFECFYRNSPGFPLPYNNIVNIRTCENEIIGTTLGGGFSFNTVTGKHIPFIVPGSRPYFHYYNSGKDIQKDITGNYVMATISGLFVFDSTGKIIFEDIPLKTPAPGKYPAQYGRELYKMANGSIHHGAGDYQDYYFSTYLPHTKQLVKPGAKEAAWQEKVLHANKKSYKKRCIWGRQDELFVFNDAEKSISAGWPDRNDFVTSPLPFDVASEITWRTQCWYLSDTLIAVNVFPAGFYLLHYNPQSRKIWCDGVKHFEDRYCSSIIKDRDGNTWVGTENGLFKYKALFSPFTVINLAEQPGGNKMINITTISSFGSTLLLGLSSNMGVLLVDREKAAIRRQIQLRRNGEPVFSVNSFTRVSRDTVWAGTSNGIFWINMLTGSSGPLSVPAHDTISKIIPAELYLTDDSNRVWMSFNYSRYNQPDIAYTYSLQSHTFHAMHPQQYPLLKPFSSFRSMAYRQGRVWISGSMGLADWSTAQQKFNSYIDFPSVSESKYGTIYIIGPDEYGSLWLSNRDGEIIQQDIASGKMHLRLPINKVDYVANGAAVIPGHTIWLGTDNGLVKFDTKTGASRNTALPTGCRHCLPKAICIMTLPPACYTLGPNITSAMYIPPMLLLLQIHNHTCLLKKLLQQRLLIPAHKKLLKPPASSRIYKFLLLP
jgi:outer membrane protein assembly factor BamB